MSIQPTVGPTGQCPLSAPRNEQGAVKAKENDPHRKLEEAMEAAKRKAEQTKRLGPPVDIKDPREILARVTGRNNPASSVKPKDRPKDTTALSRKPADSPDNRHRDTVEVKTDRSQAKAHHAD